MSALRGRIFWTALNICRSRIHLCCCSENVPYCANAFTHQLVFYISAQTIFAHELGAHRRKGRRVGNVYVLSLLFLKLIVVKRGLAYPSKKEGGCVVVAELCTSVSRAEGPRTDAQRPLKRSHDNLRATG